MDDEYAHRKEAFEVVMVKNGKNPESAGIEDFRRVPVMATDPLQAQMSDEVEAAKKDVYYPILPGKPGVLTDPEMRARARSFEASGTNPRQW